MGKKKTSQGKKQKKEHKATNVPAKASVDTKASFDTKVSFDEYKRLGEPDRKEKLENWLAAMGLQDVDGLKPSNYLIKAAKENIDGKITINDVKERLNAYYKTKGQRSDDDRTEEADKVSAHIAEILSEKTFTFSPAEYISIHRRLFTSIYKHAGIIRDYNIEKDEWVLNGDTVYYASSDNIRETLDYDFAQEKKFDYKGLNTKQKAEHIADFISGLWQIHPFAEGNTRTTAVFLIKYLRSMGFTVSNDLFAENSWYFRNALVRANYNKHVTGAYPTMEFLLRFLGNLLFGEKNMLRNRDMRIKTENDEDENKVQNKVQNLPFNCTLTEQEVIDFIAANPQATQKQIADAVSKSVRTIKTIMQNLQESGVIRRTGSKKTGQWEIVK
nr:Cell filamentation protein Fic-related protein [uncultured bacterium]